MSSIGHVIPVRPSRAVDIRCWNNSGADEIQKGNRLKQNLPKGAINVVNRADCSELASNLLNTFELHLG